MYRVELIPKSSTLSDILIPWTDSGRKNNATDGQFVFENVMVEPWVDHGVIHIHAKQNQYLYNVADFYRVKITYLGEE
jgi:hypothetical protein|tara:strand:+ start:143 stop:376 length:234 start_codon:yes stop_codon:yes gene_type:complete